MTIVYHPILHRIGERVFLSELLAHGRDAKISRNAPPFTPPRQHRGTPLDEPHLSRKPFLIRRIEDDGLLIDRGQCRAKIVVDGFELTGQRPVAPEELERGVLLELANRVALLLHMCEPIDERDTGDLGLVGDSATIAAVREDIRRVARQDDLPVLIRGETGSGKERVAQAIHEESARRDHELVSVNLCELPDSVAGAEFFGTVRGAFTGATHTKGYFRRAHGSTLFLDEIGEAKRDVQVLLLRVLETKRVIPLGTQRGEVVDVRVIAATDADLERKVDEGAFREPLFHRLAGYEIHVPPLRERRDDIGRLMLYFLGLELAKHDATDLLEQTEPAPWLPMEVVLRFVRCRWRGNVRQLRNAVRRLVIDQRDRDVATMTPGLEQLLCKSDRVPAEDDAIPDSATLPDPEPPPPLKKRVVLSALSDEALRSILRDHDWEITAAARFLGISRTTLYQRIKRSPSLRTLTQIEDAEIRRCYAECNGDIDRMIAVLEVSRSALMTRLKKLGLKK